MTLTIEVVLTACWMTCPLPLPGTPPRGKRRVWFADEILNRRSESAPGSPVGGSPFSPVVSRDGDGDGQGGSPAASPRIRRAPPPHRTAVNVGSEKTQQGIRQIQPKLMSPCVSSFFFLSCRRPVDFMVGGPQLC